jgi:predicted TIM-barrel fold metal-dependent hydrolase
MRSHSCVRRCLIGAITIASTTSSLGAQADTIRPVADHHGHLQSMAVWHLFNEQLPITALPAELDRMLRDFERGWQAPDNKIALADLFTDEGLFQYGDDWLRGRPAIRMMLLGRGGPLRLRAQVFDQQDLRGHVAGAYGFYRDTTWVDQGRFVLVLRRTPGGPWRIAVATLNRTTPPTPPMRDPYSAAEYIAELDSVGIRRGVTLSWAYQFGGAFRQVRDEAAKVRAENDWVGRQAARYSDRLVAFCSLNPLRDYALDELALCLRDPRITGLKLHLTTSFVDLRMPAHVERLRAVFQAANRGRAPIVIHLRTMNPEYGRRDAEVFLNDVLASAPDIPVQIAHLAGWGGYGRETEEALSVFAEAFAAGDRRVAHLYFDVSIGNVSTEAGDRLARHLRQIGLDRILFGVDRATPIDGVWASLTRLPLDAAELRQIAANLAPYLR